jgi:hypothetical protein
MRGPASWRRSGRKVSSTGRRRRERPFSTSFRTLAAPQIYSESGPYRSSPGRGGGPAELVEGHPQHFVSFRWQKNWHMSLHHSLAMVHLPRWGRICSDRPYKTGCVFRQPAPPPAQQSGPWPLTQCQLFGARPQAALQGNKGKRKKGALMRSGVILHFRLTILFSFFSLRLASLRQQACAKTLAPSDKRGLSPFLMSRPTRQLSAGRGRKPAGQIPPTFLPPPPSSCASNSFAAQFVLFMFP